MNPVCCFRKIKVIKPNPVEEIRPQIPNNPRFALGQTASDKLFQIHGPDQRTKWSSIALWDEGG